MKKFLTFVAICAVAVGPMAVPSVSAHQTQGTPHYGTCDPGEVCLWLYYLGTATNRHANYDGSDATYVGNVYDAGPTSLNDTVSGVRNRGTQCGVYFRQHANFGGWDAFVPQDTNWNMTGSYNNNASSHHWCTSS